MHHLPRRLGGVPPVLEGDEGEATRVAARVAGHKDIADVAISAELVLQVARVRAEVQVAHVQLLAEGVVAVLLGFALHVLVVVAAPAATMITTTAA